MPDLGDLAGRLVPGAEHLSVPFVALLLIHVPAGADTRGPGHRPGHHGELEGLSVGGRPPDRAGRWPTDPRPNTALATDLVVIWVSEGPGPPPEPFVPPKPPEPIEHPIPRDFLEPKPES
jgi:hypothetical protein